MKSWLLLILLIVGIALIGLGVYILLRNQNPQVATAPVPSSPASTPSNSWKEVKRGIINPSRAWTNAGEYSGKVFVKVAGCATLDPNRGCTTPDGIREAAPQGYVLPGAPQYMVVFRLSKPGVSGPTFQLGPEREIRFPSGTHTLWLGPNEDMSGSYGNSYRDNTGGWEYHVLVPEK